MIKYMSRKSRDVVFPKKKNPTGRSTASHSVCNYIICVICVTCVSHVIDVINIIYVYVNLVKIT